MARSPLVIVRPAKRPELAWSALTCAFFACMCKGTSGADVCGCGFAQSWRSQPFECVIEDFIFTVNSNEEKCCVKGGKPYCVCEETGQPSPIFMGGCVIHPINTPAGVGRRYSRQECLQLQKDNALKGFVNILSPADWETNPQRLVKGCAPCIKYNGEHDPCHFGPEATRAPPTCKWPTRKPTHNVS